MILGTGTDIVEISRLAEALEKIAARVFTAAELSRAESSAHRLEHLAGRWAAKEAFAKAQDWFIPLPPKKVLREPVDSVSPGKMM